jgi:hypothetical protein
MSAGDQNIIRRAGEYLEEKFMEGSHALQADTSTFKLKDPGETGKEKFLRVAGEGVKRIPDLLANVVSLPTQALAAAIGVGSGAAVALMTLARGKGSDKAKKEAEKDFYKTVAVVTTVASAVIGTVLFPLTAISYGLSRISGSKGALARSHFFLHEITTRASRAGARALDDLMQPLKENPTATSDERKTLLGAKIAENKEKTPTFIQKVMNDVPGKVPVRDLPRLLKNQGFPEEKPFLLEKLFNDPAAAEEARVALPKLLTDETITLQDKEFLVEALVNKIDEGKLGAIFEEISDRRLPEDVRQALQERLGSNERLKALIQNRPGKIPETDPAKELALLGTTRQGDTSLLAYLKTVRDDVAKDLKPIQERRRGQKKLRQRPKKATKEAEKAVQAAAGAEARKAANLQATVQVDESVKKTYDELLNKMKEEKSPRELLGFGQDEKFNTLQLSTRCVELTDAILDVKSSGGSKDEADALLNAVAEAHNRLKREAATTPGKEF